MKFDLASALHSRRRNTARRYHKTKFGKQPQNHYNVASFRTLLERGIDLHNATGKGREYLLELQWLEYEIEREWAKISEYLGGTNGIDS